MSDLYEASRKLSKAKVEVLSCLSKQVISACKSENVEDLIPVFSVLSEHDIDATELLRAIKSNFEKTEK